MVQAYYGFAVGLICDRLLRTRRDGDTGKSLQDRANIAYQRTVSRSLVDCPLQMRHAKLAHYAVKGAASGEEAKSGSISERISEDGGGSVEELRQHRRTL